MTQPFSFSTVTNFDDHILKSIKGYDTLFNNVINMSSYFVRSDTTVLDIGCSTGLMLNNMSKYHAKDINLSGVSYVGVEIDKNFVEDMKKNSLDNITFVNADISKFPISEFTSYAISLFTLQFLNPLIRKTVINNVYDNLIDGGGFVFSEKVFSENARLQDIKTSLYYQYKNDNFSADEIFEKEHSLRSMMNLKTESEIRKELCDVGFRTVETFWKNYNFVGFIAIK